MDENSGNERALLLNQKSKTQDNNSVRNHFLATPMKMILKFSMWVIFISWVSIIFLFPADFFNNWYRKNYVQATQGTVYGVTGSVFLLFSGPILVIAFLATIHLSLSGEEEIQVKKASKKPRFRLWTFPVLVDGPLGVVSAAELIGIVLFCVFIIWAICAFTLKNLNLLSGYQLTLKQEWYLMLELTGIRFGLIGLFCLAFLFLPVARGSILLRLIDIPFEHATRYHVWLGHLTMLIFTLHGLFYVAGWAMQGLLIEKLLEWKNIGVANLPGVISLLAGLLMWVTSFKPVRRDQFELFFYTHQLYVLFVVFLVLHVGDFVFCFAAAGIFLFILDRLLRFCQSRKVVNVISATCRPCGTVELVVSKPENLKYNALSFIFLQVRELSFLQWHPFSVSSSPLDGKYHIAVLSKALGGWTEKLKERISNVPDYQPQLEQPLMSHTNLTLSVEGPYGHESPYHLTYEYLVLVAGGIGISPFLAILSDILHRVKDGQPCSPKNILIIWAVKNSDELSLLYGFDMESICPFYLDTLNIEFQTFVTRESEPPLEEGKISIPMNPISFPVKNPRGVSVLVGTGHIIWSGMYVIVSTIGLILTVGLLDMYYINPYKVTYWWYKGLLLLACMVLSPLVFGGTVIGLWHFWEKISSKQEEDEGFVINENVNAQREDKELSMARVGDTKSILYGSRPDFEAIFESIAERWGYVDIGVIVCGPPTLQKSVAKGCRSRNLKKRKGNSPIFHFNSHSFDL